MNLPLFTAGPVQGQRSLSGVWLVALLLVAGGHAPLRAAPVLDARAQCGAAIVPEANVAYFSDRAALRATGIYRAARSRAAELKPEDFNKATADRREQMRPFLELMRGHCTLAVVTSAVRNFDAAGRPDTKKTPFLAAFAFDRALTPADVNELVTKAGKPALSVGEHAGYPVLTDAAQKDGPPIGIALASATGGGTTAIIGPLEFLHPALDRLQSGQVPSLNDLPGRGSASVDPAALSWLYFAPPPAAVSKLMSGPKPPAVQQENTAVAAAWNALATLNGIGLSIVYDDAMKVRLQAGFGSADDATAVRKFLENMAIPAMKIGAAAKLPTVPGVVERLRSETSGTSAALSTFLEAADLNLLPPEALMIFSW
jgi:hypothetical protein